MNNQTAAGILSTTIEKVRQLVDVSTIVGEPVILSEYWQRMGQPCKNTTNLIPGPSTAPKVSIE